MGGSRVLGIGELIRSFATLATDMKKIAARRIAAAGASMLRQESRVIAQALGLRKTGALIKNIVIKRERNVPPGTEQYNLGVRHGRDLGNGKKVTKYLALNKSGRVVTRRQNDPFYWSFLEFTTKRRTGTPFIAKALENKSTEAIAAMEAQALKEVERAASK